MPKLIRTFNWGSVVEGISQDLYNQLSQSYTNTASVVNTKSSIVAIDGSDPPASSSFNSNYSIGDLYVRTDTDTAWIMTSRTTSKDVTWTQIT